MPYNRWPLSSLFLFALLFHGAKEICAREYAEGITACQIACLYPTGYRIFPQKPLKDRLLRFDEDWPRLQTVIRSLDSSVRGEYTCTPVE